MEAISNQLSSLMSSSSFQRNTFRVKALSTNTNSIQAICSVLFNIERSCLRLHMLLFKEALTKQHRRETKDIQRGSVGYLNLKKHCSASFMQTQYNILFHFYEAKVRHTK